MNAAHLSQVGVIIHVLPAQRRGAIMTQGKEIGDRILPFIYADFLGASEPATDLVVEFRRDWHAPANRWVARAIRVLEPILDHGSISVLKPGYGFVRLKDCDVFFPREALAGSDRGRDLTQVLKVGDPVECFHQKQREGPQDFGLLVRPVDSRSYRGAVSRPRVGAATRRGLRSGKSYNDDAFLVVPMADTIWLLAVADGVSGAKNSWWASQQCMELFLRTADTFISELLGPKPKRETLLSWIREINRRFIDLRPPEYREAKCTLTFAVTLGRDFHWAHCGDSGIYRLAMTGNQAKKVIERKDHQARGQVNVLTHFIPEPPHHFSPEVGSGTLESGEMLILCSDGVVKASDAGTVGGKIRKLNDLTGAKKNLQDRIEKILDEIAEGGEMDDLTLIVFQS